MQRSWVALEECMERSREDQSGADYQRDTEEGDGELSWVVLEASRAQPHTPGSDISSFPLELGPGFFTPKSQHLQGISDSGPEILPENLECIPGMHLAL